MDKFLVGFLSNHWTYSCKTSYTNICRNPSEIIEIIPGETSEEKFAEAILRGFPLGYLGKFLKKSSFGFLKQLLEDLKTLVFFEIFSNGIQENSFDIFKTIPVGNPGDFLEESLEKHPIEFMNDFITAFLEQFHSKPMNLF